MTRGRVVVIKEYRKPFEIDEYEVPDPEPGAIILKITQAGVCGSDLHTWRGDQDAVPLPPGGRVMGHEGTGTVFRLGEGISTDSLGKPIKEGDRLMYSAIRPCMRCYQCLGGNPNWCSNSAMYAGAGAHPYFTGTYADYYYIGANQPVFKVPDELPDSVLGFVNCAMGTVTEGLMRAGCKEGDYVVVQGAGGLGLNATAMAKDMGAHKVIVMDRLDHRLSLAEEFGADHTINVEEFNTPNTRRERVLDLTEGRGADIVIELVGRAELLTEGVDMLTNGGTYIEIGNISRERTVTIDPSALLRGKKIMGSLMYRPQLLPLMMETLVKKRGKVPYEKIVSHTYPLADVNKAFEDSEWHERQTGVSRSMLIP
jgi:threonine dehydrogenase-like Zn-dependent dehydrogenase